MRKPTSKPKDSSDLSENYDFSKAVRSKFAARYAKGTSVTVLRGDKPSYMLVSAWKKYGKSETDTDCVFGLYLGEHNREVFFEGLESVEVEMDGIDHSFSLTKRKNFWTRCPELRDDESEGDGTPIRDWLKKHRSLTWIKYRPPKAMLVPLGEGRFRLMTEL